MRIVKVCSDQGGMRRAFGSRKAPDLIVSGMKEYYLNESGSKHIVNLDTDVENVDVDHNNIDLTNKAIFEKVKSIKDHCIVLGGDHSITYPAFKAFASNNPGAGLVVFDAHPDCENEWASW